ncbi:hypothetical protein [Streptomyces brasiliensis]|uniref:Uncharacterized protein n=1 Tax=Streptomyces brasiliensis TaxID=1954 RepID=A0A917L209_9ACTN|nr:hypothetical protein [Streptomyces brasiliensis]GGJ35984.1 hypothetical protein GCM10010121_053990 [Streptomyces brasiliensis]
MAEELLFVSGPLLVGVLLRCAPPSAGVLLSALLMETGTCAFVTSPALSEATRRPGPGRPARHGPRVPAGLLQPVVAAAGLGLALSGTELLVTAFVAQRSYDTAVVPWILARCRRAARWAVC